ncbi:MAG: hypothetical protein ACOC22_00710 [bacterium]
MGFKSNIIETNRINIDSSLFGIYTDSSSLILEDPCIGTHSIDSLLKGNGYGKFDLGDVSGNVDIDWNNERIRHATLTGDTSIFFQNLETGAGVSLWLTGDYAIEFPDYVRNIEGTYVGTDDNLIIFLCVDASSGDEIVTSQIFANV